MIPSKAINPAQKYVSLGFKEQILGLEEEEEEKRPRPEPIE